MGSIHNDANDDPILPDDAAEITALDAGGDDPEDQESSSPAFVDPGVEDVVDDEDDLEDLDLDDDDEDDDDDEEEDDEDDDDLDDFDDLDDDEGTSEDLPEE